MPSPVRLARINRVMLSGRVTRDFSLRYVTDGTPVALFTVAFNRPVKRKDGTWGELPGFVTVLTSHRLAEQCAERLGKGSPVYVEGRLQMREYTSREGRTRTALEIKADQVQFLERSQGMDDDDQAAAEQPPVAREGDLPF